MTNTNPIDPEIRKAVSHGLQRANAGRQRLKLWRSRTTGGYCLLVPNGNTVPVHVVRELAEIGYEPSGVSVSDDKAMYHLTDTKRIRQYD